MIAVPSLKECMSEVNLGPCGIEHGAPCDKSQKLESIAAFTTGSVLGAAGVLDPPR